MAEQVTKTPPSHESVLGRVRDGHIAEPTAPIIPEKKEETPVQAVAPIIPEKKEETPVVVNYDDMTDEVLLEVMEKRVGKKFKSLDDLKDPPKALTPEEIKTNEDREATEALEWGLASNKIKKDFYEKGIADKAKNKRDIALSLFTAELQGEDKDLSGEECEERFKEFYGENEEEGSWRHKKGAKEMNSVADAYLSQYSMIDNLTAEYRGEKTKAERQKSFQKQVSAVAKEIPNKLTFEFPYKSVDGATLDLKYEVDLDDKVLSQVVKEITGSGMENAFGDNPKVERIAAELNYHIRARMQEKVIPILLEKHGEKVLEDAMVKLKNARNPLQHLAGQAEQEKTPKAPPSHETVLNRIK